MPIIKRRPSMLAAAIGAVSAMLSGHTVSDSATTPTLTFNKVRARRRAGESPSGEGGVRYIANLNTPPKNQRQRRKARRRAWAAGDKFAFSPKN